MPQLDLKHSEQIFRAVGEPTRLRLLHLCALGEHTVSDLMSALEQSQPRVSRHLKILCDAGLLERFRDGHWVYFRVPLSGQGALAASHVLRITADDDARLIRDREALANVLGDQSASGDPELRRFNRLVVDAFLSHPVGDLLDIGVGSGAILKLLAAKATKAVGVDIDSQSRRAARRAFARASLANCTVRPGDMYRLDLADESFDTVVLDEVLLDASSPQAVLAEAGRTLRATGRMLVVEHVSRDATEATHAIPELLAAAQLHCGPIRQAYDGDGQYLLAMATPANDTQSRRSA
ncbi:MAG: metalloregulator ArsR/SmtB family transcription factor [Pseudomonadota bacterium]